ncbi:MAG: T9SS type A sorting domain-containing protein [Ignavibacteria bacterium]|nr:T9SS type A sorting domain-containing protein [Ignavibacteria bacterium]
MQLRLSVNSAPSPGNGYIISDTLQGTRVVRMKLETTAKAFDTQFLNLRWRNGPSNPVTRIYSFVDMAYTEITNSSSHLIDSLQNPLPVELTDFNSSVYANKVNLSWTTASEHNNKGFYIERNFSVNGSNSFEWISIGFIKGSGDLNTVTEYSFQDKDLMTGVYQYRLKQTDYNGLYEYFYLNNEVEILRPVDFKLSQNYPNPFNPSTNIEFTIPADGNVRLDLYDITGREVKNILSGNYSAGYYNVKINAEDLSGGIYFYRLTAGSFTSAKKMILLK